MSIQSIEKIVEQLKIYEQRQRGVEHDADISPERKQREYQVIGREKAAAKSEIYQAFADEWAGMFREARKLKAEQFQADELQAAGWHFERLAFAARQVEAAIAGAEDEPLSGVKALQVLEKSADEVLKSGDKHLARAWCEIAPGLIRARFGADGSALARKLERELPALTDTPALQAQRERGAEFANRTIRLAELTKQAAEIYHEDPILTTNEMLLSLMKGVEIAKTINAEKGSIITAVDYVDERMHPLVAEKSLLPGSVAI